MVSAYTIRPVLEQDRQIIASLVHFEPFTHRHLDWRSPLDWVGSPFFWLAELNNRPVAALACPPDPQGVFWLRVFTSADSVPLTETWQALWEVAKKELQEADGNLAAIAQHSWLIPLLQKENFHYQEDIITLEISSAQIQPIEEEDKYLLRAMTEEDLPTVQIVDAQSFPPLWQNSLPALRLAFQQAGMATVAQNAGQIIAYQLSTLAPFGAHIARLAVHPQFQGRGVGRALVSQLVAEMRKRELRRVTVNTQSHNSTSLALYAKLGFQRTGESYPVFLQNVEEKN